MITGIGLISCLGCDRETVARSLQEGRGGIVFDPERRKLGFRSGLTGALRGFEPEKYGLGRRQAHTMAEPALYAFAAAQQALAQARLDAESLRTMRAGVIFGNDSSVKAGVEAWQQLRQEQATYRLGAGAIFKIMNSTVTMNLATQFHISGANWTLSAACASGAHAVGQAALLIRSGLQDVMVCGGAQEINPECMAPFDALGAFSTREAEPDQASRPFDKDRDGLVPGGGAAALILESPAHAAGRSAQVLGRVLGYGFSSDGGHLIVPFWPRSAAAMQMALDHAGVKPEEIDYINAHATSTPRGDAAEAQAIAHLFPHRPYVSSTKSLTGHECWMSGASEVAYCVLMARAGFIAGNANFVEGDELTRSLNIPARSLPHTLKRVLSNSFGFGGTNASLVLGF